MAKGRKGGPLTIEYRPFAHRTADRNYQDLLRTILIEGEDTMPQQEEEARGIDGYKMTFDLSNGFPLITERDLVSTTKNPKFSIWNQSLGELFGFLHGARTQSELASYGCFWWKRWVTPEKCAKRGLSPGDLGPGSYGAAWTAFPTSEGIPFNQITHLIEQIKEKPHLRTHFLTPWIPQYAGRGKGKQQRVVVAPCHGWVHIKINTRTGNLKLIHFQRSCDTPVGLVCNLIEYGALAMMIAQVTGYRAEKLVYMISDAHIYVNQQKDVHDLLQTAPQVFPTVTLNSSVKDILDFRQEHFTVTDYNPQLPPRSIWTPV